jgi:hypothetical protein
MSYPGQVPYHIEAWYKTARRGVDEGWALPRHLAEVNILGQEAVVRIRSNGKVRRVPLTGRDPLMFNVGSSQCEILEYLGSSKIPRAYPQYEERCTDCVGSIDIYVRCRPALDLSSEEAMMKVFESRAPEADLFIVVRPDHYFPGHAAFPLLYAFEEEVRVPTPAELQGRKGFSVLIRRKESKKRQGAGASVGEYRPAQPELKTGGEGEPPGFDPGAPITRKEQAPARLQRQIQTLSSRCLEKLGIQDRAELATTAGRLCFWDGRPEEEGNIQIAPLFGEVTNVRSGDTFHSVSYGCSAIVLTYESGDISPHVVLGTDFWRKNAPEQGTTLFPELLRFHLNGGDAFLAQKYAGYKGSKPDEASQAFSKWLRGSCP